MRFKWCIAIVLLSFLGTLPAFCQNAAKIHLSDTVTSVTRETTIYNKKKENYFAIHLYLQFRNATDSPLIIFKPGLFWGKTRLSFVDSLNTQVEADFFFERLWQKSDPTYDAVARHMIDLATPEPNATYFARIEPLSYYECQVTLSVENGYKAEKRIGRSPTDVYYVAIPEFREFKLKYFLSTKKRPEKIDLVAAQQKWTRFGELVLDSDGDYNIESDIILNNPAD